MKRRPQLIYEDEHVLVVSKPPFLLTVPDRYAPEKANLFHMMQERYGRVFVVHRLDKETSGILVMARNEEAHRHLSLQFEHREVEKAYLTIVEGRLHYEEGLIDKPLMPIDSKPVRVVVSAKGKPAQTRYKVVEYLGNFTLVRAWILTGRMHQVRVHFQALGYPLVVDPLYGRRDAFYLSEIKRNYHLAKGEEERPLLARSALHAEQLTFTHPATEERMTFEAPLPRDMAAVVKQLRKWAR